MDNGTIGTFIHVKPTGEYDHGGYQELNIYLDNTDLPSQLVRTYDVIQFGDYRLDVTPEGVIRIFHTLAAAHDGAVFCVSDVANCEFETGHLEEVTETVTVTKFVKGIQ